MGVRHAATLAVAVLAACVTHTRRVGAPPPNTQPVAAGLPDQMQAIARQALALDAAADRAADTLYAPGAPVVANAGGRLAAPRFAGVGDGGPITAPPAAGDPEGGEQQDRHRQANQTAENAEHDLKAQPRQYGEDGEPEYAPEHGTLREARSTGPYAGM